MNIKGELIILKSIDSIIHRHLFISPFFDTDEELQDFLTKLALKIIEIELIPTCNSELERK